MAGGLCGVAEVQFDDLSVPIERDVYAGSYSGIAEIDNSGSVVALTIHGYDAAGKPADIYIPRKFSDWKTTAENFADEVGRRVESRYAGLIEELLSDWHYSLGIQEFEAAE